MRSAATLFAIVLGVGPALGAEIVVEHRVTPVVKPVFGQVQSRDTVPARARIGGTVVEIRVDEGDAVATGEPIAVIVDDKLALRLDALIARQAAVSAQRVNARTNLERAQQLFSRGTIPKSRLDEMQTAFEVLQNEISAIDAEKAVIEQQAEEGTVIAPSSGRVLRVPVTQGSVILPGEEVARIAAGGYFLRLSLPERHAGGINQGDTVMVGARGLRAGSDAPTLPGRLVKIYPEIRDGRVIADVEVSGLGDFFVGERTLVTIPVGTRQRLAVPESAVTNRHGIDFVTIRIGERDADVTVVRGETFVDESGERLVEVLTGLRPGDVVVTP